MIHGLIRAWSLAAVAMIGLLAGLFVLEPLPVNSQSQAQQAFSFGLIGDLGYFPQHEPWVANVFIDLNKQAPMAFVAHVGDLSSPRYACTDEMQARRLAQFQASSHPLVFTPGDNDWTDCHEPAVKGVDPLERLSTLRALFFQGERSLGQRTIALDRQSNDPSFSKYRENARWDIGGVTFATLHVVGSNNGLGRTPEGDAEFAERNTANLAWLRQAFAHAKANNSRAVMVVQQANIFPDFPPLASPPKQPSGYTEFRTELEKETVAFGKPVVLVHGDSHYFRIDNPLRTRQVSGVPGVPAPANFMRLETFGNPNHHWVEVIVDPNQPGVFTFRPRFVAANIERGTQ
jgi:hypothetical protein